jgi:hypothetical protein
MSDLRRSERKRTQTQFEAATETVANSSGRTKAVQGRARRARAAAIAAAYEPLVGLVQLGEAGGGEGSVWVAARESRSCEVDGHVWCRSCSYQVHGDTRGNGGQHTEFATTDRPNNRCSGCAGCSY